MKLHQLLIAGLLSAFVSAAHAEPADSLRVYSKEAPLVYEDVWDLWPYSFLNDNGEPEGFNIDLIKLLMKELNLPYVIKLKPSDEAFKDLKEGKSDLMLGLAVGFHDEYGLYSKNAVTLFTQSVVTPSSKPVEIKTFKDLGKPGLKVIVNDSSLCHHLMIDYGWAENALPNKDIREAIQQVSAQEDGQIVWNTLSLKWLLRRYRIDNLELTPVNMPHGEYKFMSNNQQLLDMLDDAYTKLSTAEKLTEIQTKWFYPERQKPSLPTWIWYVAGAGLVVLLILCAYGISYRLQSKRLMRHNNKSNRRLALILQTSHVRIWTYDIKANQFSWRNNNGQVAYTYTMSEFAQRYSEEDFQRLKDSLDKLAAQEKPANGIEEKITLELKAKDTEEGSSDLRDYVIVLSVLRRDKNGMPTVIIGTKKDVTDEMEQKRLDDERTLRYWSIFYTPIVGIMLFDRNGILTNINPKACELYDCDPEAIINEKPSINSILDLGNLDLRETDGFYATQFLNFDKIPDSQRMVKSIKRTGKVCNEFKLMTINDDSGNLLGIFAICRDITNSVTGIDLEQEGLQRVNAAKAILEDYALNIDRTLEQSDIRMVKYQPDSHTLTIYSSTDAVQQALTQTRCMTLVDDRSKKLAMRLLNDMDERADKKIQASIRTTLRTKQGTRLELDFDMNPVRDKDGNIREYGGLLRDFSELRHLEHLMDKETAKVQEVENTKNSFVKNMVQDIRTPLDSMLNYVGQLNETTPSENEAELSKGIQENADYLLHLIDNILFLSRLEAHMVEIKKQPQDFAQLFESQCMTGWSKFQNADTRYVVENAYEQLVVDIDAVNLGHVIEQVTANAAQHTQKGTIRARYDYIGRRLMISIDDTGDGIPKKELAHLNQMDTGNVRATKGLGIAITKELVKQMGGTIEISSEENLGTTVYIMLPCHASAIKRKKMS